MVVNINDISTETLCSNFNAAGVGKRAVIQISLTIATVTEDQGIRSATTFKLTMDSSVGAQTKTPVRAKDTRGRTVATVTPQRTRGRACRVLRILKILKGALKAAPRCV